MPQSFRASWRISSAVTGMGLLLASCQTGGPAPVPAALKMPAPEAAAPAQAQPDASFTAWLDQARRDALKHGITPATVNAALTDITPISRVIESDRRQPEFSQTFSRYIGNAITEKRVADGRALMAQHRALLAELEREYGVPGRFLVAFWGMESNYGRVLGDYPVVTALATLAYDGRRGEMFRGELFDALRILDQGHVALPQMKGSWAGAMGQTQFMPSNFLKHGVDKDRDGRIDLWKDTADALASTANYLRSLGWNGERTWGREVRLPADFDVALSSVDVDATEVVKPLRAWAALGVKRADGGPLPAQDVSAALILPAGANGPAFLVYDNFRTILKYNRSAFYAVAIGYLADRVASGEAWISLAREGEPLRREEVLTLQNGLIALGFYKGTADGAVGSATRRAVRAFQKANGLTADGYASRDIIAAVVAKLGAA